MDKATKAERIAAEWARYRERARSLSSNRRLPWGEYLEADQRAFRSYLDAEQAIRAEREAA